MRIGQNKLDFFSTLYKEASDANVTNLDNMQKWDEQYAGSTQIDKIYDEAGIPSDSNPVTRNVTFELCESQFSAFIPPPAVTPRYETDATKRNAINIEQALIALRKKLPYEKFNDLDERYSVKYGGDVWLIEWDNSIITHNTCGDIKVKCLSPKHFVGQPGIFDIDEMDYCFINYDTTIEELQRQYDLEDTDVERMSLEKAENDTNDTTCQVVICYYKDEDDKVCKYVFSGDVELEDIENYYSRKKRICKNCGKREELCECDNPDYEAQDDEFEELEEDIIRSDGTVIPVMSPIIKNGEYAEMVDTTQQVMNPDGSMAMEDVSGVMLPKIESVQVPKTQKTKLPYYQPTKFPIVIRNNISKEDSLFGQSDCDILRPIQQAINKVETRIDSKICHAGVFLTVPETYSGQIDNSLYDNVIKIKPGEERFFGRYDLQVNTQEDMIRSDKLAEQGKKVIGITDSYQGNYDGSARSGIAKQVQVQQSAGRLMSKKTMKNSAYAQMDEIIFQYYLAYADEERKNTYRDYAGQRREAAFSRYDFLEFDSTDGTWYYNDQYLFDSDPAGAVEQDRESTWNRIKADFSAGTYGNIQMPETLLFYWNKMAEAHYPGAVDMVERFSEIVNTQIEQATAALEVGPIENPNDVQKPSDGGMA